MASISACAPLRAYRPLSGRLRSVTSACQRQLSDGTGTRRTPSLSPKHTYSIPIIPQPHVGLVAQRSHGSHIQSSLRSFSTSRVACSRAVVNPRKDDDGNDMLVDITPRASNRLHAIAQQDSNPSLCLRVTVESGGCHGFQYLMSLTSTDKISHEEDTVFESEDGNKAKVVLDESSLELLKGSKIDYTMELIGSQFKVTGIPGAKSSCGCGTSFDIQA